MRSAFALRIFSGKIIFNRAMPERLRTLRHCIFTDGNAPPGGAVAQRLRGYKSAEPEKTVKRSSRRTGVNLQFFPV
ncbi:hypothetical protein DWZ25_13525 [Faecalibacterium prausnitzii]|uniref:Uncharacterized protein n=1 Tax=Faecalibacterium prausnitzii TaxID=853 RepID=A0A3E2TTW9_9FIRM|nr:hypothetical protein DWZ25_13525 [Faecalibacterium prausnitzii]